MENIYEMEFSDSDVLLLFEEVNYQYKVDFRDYNINHLKRRISHRMKLTGLSFSELYNEIVNNNSFFRSFFQDLSIKVTEMYREPDFFLKVREKLVPEFVALPDIKIWIAGCSSGEEVYSLAIILKEEGLLQKSRIIATDFNEDSLEIASKGRYALSKLEGIESRYKLTGGKQKFDGYYSVVGDKIKIDPELTRKIVFANHNLVSDKAFEGTDLILCRNVLIYFNLDLQNRIVDKLYKSLNPKGFLCLGKQESIRFSIQENLLKPIDPDAKIYQK